MPSPAGHALGSLAAGWLCAGPASPRRALLVQTAWLVALGVAPDLDLLWGRHSRETHSLGAAVAVAAVAAWRRWPLGPARRRGIFGTALVAWFVHAVMDVHSIDDAAPVGVLLLWPISPAFVHASWAVFDPISRHFDQPGVWVHNARAAWHEVLRIGPVTTLVWWARRRHAR